MTVLCLLVISLGGGYLIGSRLYRWPNPQFAVVLAMWFCAMHLLTQAVL